MPETPSSLLMAEGKLYGFIVVESLHDKLSQKRLILLQIISDQMELSALFQEAVASSKELKERPSNDTLLQLYSLYKQATEGDNLNDPPANPFDFVAKAKFEAWNALAGKPQEKAMEEYIALVNKLKG